MVSGWPLTQPLIQRSLYGLFVVSLHVTETELDSGDTMVNTVDTGPNRQWLTI